MENNEGIKQTNRGNDSSKWARRAVIAASTWVAVTATGFAVWSAMGPKNDTPPETAAKQWAEKLKLPYRGAACTTRDTDDDGYVSCVLALDGPEKVYFQGLQCGEQGSRKAGGCKPDAKNPEVKLVMDVPVKSGSN